MPDRRTDPLENRAVSETENERKRGEKTVGDLKEKFGTAGWNSCACIFLSAL